MPRQRCMRLRNPCAAATAPCQRAPLQHDCLPSCQAAALCAFCGPLASARAGLGLRHCFTDFTAAPLRRCVRLCGLTGSNRCPRPRSPGTAPAVETHQQADAHAVADLHVGQVGLDLLSLQLVNLHESTASARAGPWAAAAGDAWCSFARAARRPPAAGNQCGPGTNPTLVRAIYTIHWRAAAGNVRPASLTSGARPFWLATMRGCARTLLLATAGRCCVNNFCCASIVLAAAAAGPTNVLLAEPSPRCFVGKTHTHKLPTRCSVSWRLSAASTSHAHAADRPPAGAARAGRNIRSAMHGVQLSTKRPLWPSLTTGVRAADAFVGRSLECVHACHCT
mgnify:CR=1 FL=1